MAYAYMYMYISYAVFILNLILKGGKLPSARIEEGNPCIKGRESHYY